MKINQLVCLVLFLFLPIAQSTENQKLPHFTGQEFHTGKPVQIDRFFGNIIYLDFWASWCAPCIESMPFMDKLYQQYAAKGFEVIAINIDEKKQDAKEFLKEFPVTYLNLYDPKGRIAKQLKVSKMPTAFLIDREGNILFKHIGFNQEYSERLELAIRMLVKK